jgi:hypothetical protein
MPGVSGGWYARELAQRAKIETRHPEWSKERKDAYVFAVLRRMGWRPSRRSGERKVRAE